MVWFGLEVHGNVAEIEGLPSAKGRSRHLPIASISVLICECNARSQMNNLLKPGGRLTALKA